MLLYSSREGILSPELNKFINKISIQLFGTKKSDTKFKFPEGFYELADDSEERLLLNEKYYDYEDGFETTYMTDEEIVEFFLTRGLDFGDQHGRPLLCAKILSRQAEAAAKGIVGSLPNIGNIRLVSWGNKLEREALEFRADKNRK